MKGQVAMTLAEFTMSDFKSRHVTGLAIEVASR